MEVVVVVVEVGVVGEHSTLVGMLVRMKQGSQPHKLVFLHRARAVLLFVR